MVVLQESRKGAPGGLKIYSNNRTFLFGFGPKWLSGLPNWQRHTAHEMLVYVEAFLASVRSHHSVKLGGMKELRSFGFIVASERNAQYNFTRYRALATRKGKTPHLSWQVDEEVWKELHGHALKNNDFTFAAEGASRTPSDMSSADAAAGVSPSDIPTKRESHVSASFGVQDSQGRLSQLQTGTSAATPSKSHTTTTKPSASGASSGSGEAMTGMGMLHVSGMSSSTAFSLCCFLEKSNKLVKEGFEILKGHQCFTQREIFYVMRELSRFDDFHFSRLALLATAVERYNTSLHQPQRIQNTCWPTSLISSLAREYATLLPAEESCRWEQRWGRKKRSRPSAPDDGDEDIVKDDEVLPQCKMLKVC